MSQIAIALAMILLLALLWRALRPGMPLLGLIGGSRRVMTPPYMFPAINSRTTIHLP
jgi:hypothetical protein